MIPVKARKKTEKGVVLRLEEVIFTSGYIKGVL